MRANAKYNAKAYDRIEFKVPKGRKQAIQSLASEAGQSLNGYLVQAVNERVEREKGVKDYASIPRKV
jgi:predicted HicB family RNase H-like nuclease